MTQKLAHRFIKILNLYLTNMSNNYANLVELLEKAYFLNNNTRTPNYIY